MSRIGENTVGKVLVSEEAQGALSFGHVDNMAWYIVGLIYDSYLNIRIYEMWDGMTSLGVAFIRYYYEMFLERMRKINNLSHGDEQSSSVVISGPPNTKQVF